MSDPEPKVPPPRRAKRKQIPLRLDASVHAALVKWANDDLRSVNAQIEIILRHALSNARRLPRDVKPIRSPGRPRNENPDQGNREEHQR